MTNRCEYSKQQNRSCIAIRSNEFWRSPVLFCSLGKRAHSMLFFIIFMSNVKGYQNSAAMLEHINQLNIHVKSADIFLNKLSADIKRRISDWYFLGGHEKKIQFV